MVRKGVDLLIIELVNVVTGRILKEVSAQQRCIFKNKIMPIRTDIIQPSLKMILLEDMIDFIFKHLCMAFVRKDFGLITRQELKKYIKKEGKMLSKEKYSPYCWSISRNTLKDTPHQA